MGIEKIIEEKQRTFAFPISTNEKIRKWREEENGEWRKYNEKVRRRGAAGKIKSDSVIQKRNVSLLSIEFPYWYTSTVISQNQIKYN